MRRAIALGIISVACLLAAAPARPDDSARGGDHPAVDQLKPFTTDGCSDFPDGTPQHKDLWLKCCTAHDRKYWIGGTYEERLKADMELRECVQSVGEPAIANLMLAGVRVGGSPFWPTRFRWGYGWPFTHGYRALTPEEQEQVRRTVEQEGGR